MGTSLEDAVMRSQADYGGEFYKISVEFDHLTYILTLSDGGGDQLPVQLDLDGANAVCAELAKKLDGDWKVIPA